MKKIFFALLVCSCFILGCQKKDKIIENENLNKEVTPDETISTTATTKIVEKDNNYFIEISSLDFKNKVNSSETYIYFIGRDTCPACQKFKPIAKEFSSNEKITIYYVNTTNFDDSDWNIIDEFVDVKYIPTIVVSQKSSILYSKYGIHQYSELENLVHEFNIK